MEGSSEHPMFCTERRGISLISQPSNRTNSKYVYSSECSLQAQKSPHEALRFRFFFIWFSTVRIFFTFPWTSIPFLGGLLLMKSMGVFLFKPGPQISKSIPAFNNGWLCCTFKCVSQHYHHF